MTQNPFIRDTNFDTIQVNNTPFFLNRQNRQFIYVYHNSSSPAIFQVGDYQTAVLPQEQWVLWPWPDTQKIAKILPTYTTYLSTFCTDAPLTPFAPYQTNAYQLYARSEQAFSVFFNAAITVGQWFGLQFYTQTNPPNLVTAVFDKIIVTCLTAPQEIRLTQSLTQDSNLTGVLTPTNNRLDAVNHNIIPSVSVISGASLASSFGTTSIDISPGTLETDVLKGDIRVIPKLSNEYLGIYVKSASATNICNVNVTWHEEY